MTTSAFLSPLTFPSRHRAFSRRSPRRPPRAALPSQYQRVSWPQVESICHRLANLARSDSFDTVLAITRGGLVPATLLCEELQLRNVLSATVMFYTDTGEQFFGMTQPRFLSFPSIDMVEGRRVLVVDDVWDSGRTANAVKKRVLLADPDIVKVAVMHFKPDMNVEGVEPDFYVETTKKWILYPWEMASPTVQKETADGGIHINVTEEKEEDSVETVG